MTFIQNALKQAKTEQEIARAPCVFKFAANMAKRLRQENSKSKVMALQLREMSEEELAVKVHYMC